MRALNANASESLLPFDAQVDANFLASLLLPNLAFDRPNPPKPKANLLSRSMER